MTEQLNDKPPSTPSATTPTPDQDRLAALAFWSEEIRPKLGDIPMDGLRYLRDRYMTDALSNPDALAQLREWWLARLGGSLGRQSAPSAPS